MGRRFGILEEFFDETNRLVAQALPGIMEQSG